jgi:hypothetical protein
MPFKSKAQRRKFAQLLVEGKITPEVYEEWNQETGGTTLPERVKDKPAARKKRQTTPKKRKTTRQNAKKTRSRRVPSARRRGAGSKRPKRKGTVKR